MVIAGKGRAGFERIKCGEAVSSKQATRTPGGAPSRQGQDSSSSRVLTEMSSVTRISWTHRLHQRRSIEMPHTHQPELDRDPDPAWGREMLEQESDSMRRLSMPEFHRPTNNNKEENRRRVSLESLPPASVQGEMRDQKAKSLGLTRFFKAREEASDLSQAPKSWSKRFSGTAAGGRIGESHHGLQRRA
mmetsp:Transcript_23514/g.36786  ORF Transcript_23514/g.36786 Transcript_23514/m.36786 type:complete len:189 (-) Transcript_23514:51-617(-)